MQFSILIIILIYFENSLETFEIIKWDICSSDGRITVKNISSPVDSYSALFQNSLIEWPWKGFNDVKYRWVAHQNFIFRSEPFSIDPSASTSLFVSGLDVSAMIYINDKYIGIIESEFISNDFIIDPSKVQRSNNILKIVFPSSLLLANETASRSSYDVAPDCWPKEFNGDCHINFIRKTQASFGWDWGPSIAAVGIRGKLEFSSANHTTGKIKYVKILTKTDKNCSHWSADIVVNIFVILAEKGSKICVISKISNIKFEAKQCLDVLQNGLIEFRFHINLNDRNLKLWWPHDLGTPVLYEMMTYVLLSGKILDHKLQYVGFRSILLNQTKLPNHYGRYFGFFINCKPIFIKGSNWVPRTYLTQNWNNESYIEFLMNSVVKANMNSIRLWGGGKPETEHFYNVADRLGVMVWHDLMFACALYPNDDKFISIVQKEVTEIVNRLQIHPCILLWSGNNEIEVLIAQGWYNTTIMDPQNIKRYQYLFKEIIETEVTSVDPFAIYIMSSPSNGIESEKDQGVSKNPQSQYFGDVHFYLYYGDVWNKTRYPVTRMTTEFGFQSLPHKDTWQFMVRSEIDYEIDGLLMKHLQHHPDGNKQLIDTVLFYFGKLYSRKVTLPSEKYRWFSYLTQINQAVILGNYIDKLLSSQCILTPDGLGLTRGAMYWQLNDNWIAPTWSTIDWLGQWKIGHYFVKNSFSPERIIIENINDLINIILILKNEFVRTQYKIVIRSRNITRIIELSIIKEENVIFNTKTMKCNVEKIMSVKTSQFIQKYKCTNINHCLFEVILLQNQSVISNDTLMLVNPLYLEIPSKVAANKISVKIRQGIPNYSICMLNLYTNYIHLFVTLTTSHLGAFSDNGFHITNNDTLIYFNPWNYRANQFFNCSQLTIDIYSLNELYL